MSFKEDRGSDESLLDSDRESDEIEWTRSNQRQSWRKHVWAALNLLLFLTSLGLFVAASFKLSSESEMDYIRKTSFYCELPSAPLNADA